jgi:hypothetical protein
MYVATSRTRTQSRPEVTALLLRGNRLGSTALLLLTPHLCARAALGELDLAANRITDSGLVALFQVRELVWDLLIAWMGFLLEKRLSLRILCSQDLT